MKLVKISQYNPQTMQLALPVYDGKRRILLGAGRTIHPRYLDMLKKLGISYLVVEDSESKGITIDEMMDMPTWTDAIAAIQEVYEEVKTSKKLPLIHVQKLTGRLLLEAKKRKALVLVPSSSVATEAQLYAHVINVTLLSLQIGRRLHFNDLQLRDLSIGCLLHDIGKVLTTDEQEHAQAGFSFLKNNREISLVSAHIAFQHHEAIDGSGHPRGLTGNEFIQAAQICGIANFYEDLISEQHLLPHEALECIMAVNGIKYGESVVRAFVQGIPSYTPGSRVQLNTGELAIVTRVNSQMQRPTVRVLSTGQELSLEDHTTLMITGVVEESS